MQVSSNTTNYSTITNSVRPSPINPIEDNKESLNLKENDELRQAVVASVGYQSKINQIEIYVAGSTGNEVDLSTNTTSLLETYSDLKRNSDAINAYA